MVTSNLPPVDANATLIQLADDAGRLVYLPATTVNHFLARGQSSLMITLNLKPGELPEEWLTVTEAARLHLDDVDGITLGVAQAKISRACSREQVISQGESTKRRIEPRSLDAWRLAERERDLRRQDAGK